MVYATRWQGLEWTDFRRLVTPRSMLFLKIQNISPNCHWVRVVFLTSFEAAMMVTIIHTFCEVYATQNERRTWFKSEPQASWKLWRSFQALDWQFTALLIISLRSFTLCSVVRHRHKRQRWPEAQMCAACRCWVVTVIYSRKPFGQPTLFEPKTRRTRNNTLQSRHIFFAASETHLPLSKRGCPRIKTWVSHQEYL